MISVRLPEKGIATTSRIKLSGEKSKPIGDAVARGGPKKCRVIVYMWG